MMGAYDFMWNSIQSGQIHDVETKVKHLEKNMDIAKQWIDYLNKRINELEKQNANIGCKSCNCQSGGKSSEELSNQ
jgi:hypothetical protein